MPINAWWSALVVDLKRRLGRLSPELGAHLEIISKKISAIFSNQRQEDFTDHKPDGHSERIIRILNDLCSEMMEMKDKKLNVQEIFVLLASAYVHDVGMQYGKDSTLTLMDVRETSPSFRRDDTGFDPETNRIPGPRNSERIRRPDRKSVKRTQKNQPVH